jgi:nitroreductase
MPTTAVETDVIKDAVQIACRAPSLHNSQPWQWVFNRGQLRLFLDPSRVMDTDHSAREALISCGGALDFVTERDRRLAGAIEARRTDRLPFSAVTEWQSIEAVVASSANRQAVHLEVIADELHPRLEEAAQIAESLRFYDTPYHNELRWWTAPFEASEGIPYSALVSAAEGDRVGVGRAFPVPRRPERRLEVPEDHAKVLLLSTDDDTRADALVVGEALSATLLECTMAGLATCPVTHLTEVGVTRELIRSLMDHAAVPQVLIRVGVVPVTEKVPPPTPRRPLSAVLRLRGCGE